LPTSCLSKSRSAVKDLNLGGATALVTFGGHDHIIPSAESQVALLLPLVKVLAGIDLAANSLNATDGPVLVKSGGSLDRRLVDTSRLVNVVNTAVILNCAEFGCAGRGVVRAVRLDNVILDEGVGGPAVKSEVCFPVLVIRKRNKFPKRRRKKEKKHTAVDVVVVPGAVIVHNTRRARVPALAANPVVHVVPRDAVRASRAVVVVDRASTVSPVRVEETVVGAGSGLDTALDGLKRAGGNRGREGREEKREGNHDVDRTKKKNVLTLWLLSLVT